MCARARLVQAAVVDRVSRASHIPSTRSLARRGCGAVGLGRGWWRRQLCWSRPVHRQGVGRTIGPVQHVDMPRLRRRRGVDRVERHIPERKEGVSCG